eukprot:scaffold139245_cov19-Prasinocladus_malaysianus.AAC.1
MVDGQQVQEVVPQPPPSVIPVEDDKEPPWSLLGLGYPAWAGIGGAAVLVVLLVLVCACVRVRQRTRAAALSKQASQGPTRVIVHQQTLLMCSRCKFDNDRILYVGYKINCVMP